MKAMTEITLYDLMAEDLDVWITPSKCTGFDLQIDDMDGKSLVNEQGLHPGAADSFADFCRRYIMFYDRAVTLTNGEQ